ncbi:MAG TPA: hypothetical protein VIM98_03485 [Dyella sp.]|uniref:hypothetical protein n=1 Tax=Dyella sp. TaxID=1869338 RepID=UPI002F9426F9
MKTSFWSKLDKPWWFAACAVFYIGFVGPRLISAPDSLAVLGGIVLLLLLVAWGYRLFIRMVRRKDWR